jgi:hypothetical protein
VGLYIHWTVVLLGALLPVVPVAAELMRRRSQSPPRETDDPEP